MIGHGISNPMPLKIWFLQTSRCELKQMCVEKLSSIKVMTKLRAVITGIGANVPNTFSPMKNWAEWLILLMSGSWHAWDQGETDHKGEGRGSSEVGAAAVNQLLSKTGTKTGRNRFADLRYGHPWSPVSCNSKYISDKTGIKNAFQLWSECRLFRFPVCPDHRQ